MATLPYNTNRVTTLHVPLRVSSDRSVLLTDIQIKACLEN